MSRKNAFGPYLLPNGYTTWKRFPMKDAKRVKFSKRDLVNQSLTGQKVSVVTLDETVKLEAKAKKKIQAAYHVGVDMASGPDQTVHQVIERPTGA